MAVLVVECVTVSSTQTVWSVISLGEEGEKDEKEEVSFTGPSVRQPYPPYGAFDMYVCKITLLPRAKLEDLQHFQVWKELS